MGNELSFTIVLSQRWSAWGVEAPNPAHARVYDSRLAVRRHLLVKSVCALTARNIKSIRHCSHGE